MSEKRFNPAKMAKLDNPERRKAFPPEKILSHLPMKEQDNVLDIGAGTGYFTFPAAKMTKGTVYALDVAPEMLEVLKERAVELQLDNVVLVQGVIEDIPLEDELVDHIIASYVLHEVEPLSKGLEEISRVLNPGGHLLCIEWEKKPMEQGPPEHHRIHSEELQAAFKEQGFTIVELSFPTDAHYMLVVRK